MNLCFFVHISSRSMYGGDDEETLLLSPASKWYSTSQTTQKNAPRDF